MFGPENTTDFLYVDSMDWGEGSPHNTTLAIASMVVYLVSILFGSIFNFAALIVFARHHLWRQHEGYLYLLAIFIGNIVIVVVVIVTRFLWLFPDSYRLQSVSDFTCKTWRFLYNVFDSTGWYVCATLFNVCLRTRLARGTGCGYWRKVASWYCTVTGTLTVIVIMTVCFIVINCWTLWAAQVTVYGGRWYCITLYSVYENWDLASLGIQWFASVCFLLPVSLLLTLWSQCRPEVGFGFSFFGQDDQSGDDRDFSRLSLIVGFVAFLLLFPLAVVELWTFTSYHSNMFTINKVCQLVFSFHVVVVPLCCLAGVEHTKDDLRSLFRGGWCPWSRRDKAVEETNDILALESAECPPSQTVSRD